MPNRTRQDDRRGHGVGNNIGTKVDPTKANRLDQRGAGAYAPPPPSAGGGSASSEFAAGVAAARPQGSGAKLGQAKSRTMGSPRLGGGA
jgi:hypothetical protein